MYFVHISIFCWFLPFPGVSQTRFKLKQDHLRPKLFFNKAIKYETNKTWRYIEIKRYKKKLKAGYEGISGYNDVVIVPRGLHFSMPNWFCTLKRAEGIVIPGRIQECLKVGGGGRVPLKERGIVRVTYTMFQIHPFKSITFLQMTTRFINVCSNDYESIKFYSNDHELSNFAQMALNLSNFDQMSLFSLFRCPLVCFGGERGGVIGPLKCPPPTYIHTPIIKGIFCDLFKSVYIKNKT